MKCIRYEPHLEKCKSKIKILSTRNIFCRKFAGNLQQSVEKMQLFAPAILTHEATANVVRICTFYLNCSMCIRNTRRYTIQLVLDEITLRQIRKVMFQYQSKLVSPYLTNWFFFTKLIKCCHMTINFRKTLELNVGVGHIRIYVLVYYSFSYHAEVAGSI